MVIMKSSFILKLFILILGVNFFWACEEADSEKEWGNSYIYMPQAMLLSEGLNNNYIVPTQINGINNYKIEQNTLQVFLGVYRSGLEVLEDFAVDVSVNNDTCVYCIAGAMLPEADEAFAVYANAILLPADMYSLPPIVSVDAGQRRKNFYLSIDREKLEANKTGYTGKDLVLAVKISNPTRYKLNSSLSTTMVIVKNWESLK